MKLKVCGMRETHNIEQLLGLNPDYVGFIFYKKSPRYIGGELNPEVTKSFPRDVRKVGVFVNTSLDEMLEAISVYDLDMVQLHGEETPDEAAELYALGIRVIKAFAIHEDFDFSILKSYHPFVEYFLFDTKAEQRGGTGKKFDWKLLRRYDQKLPFFLSGGIDLEDMEQILALEGLNIHAIDVNSRFELRPGLKDIDKLERLTKKTK